MIHSLFAIVGASIICLSQGFVSTKFSASRQARVQPIAESFGLEIAEDQFKNSDPLVAGEANYKKFVESYAPDGLVLGGPSYDVITRLRQLKLLTLTAESGLLETLEAKGLTLSQIEKLLPLVDDLGLLPLAASQKDLILNTALPLVIEPAPLLLPIVVNVLKTDASTFLAAGGALVGAGIFESLDNVLLGAPLVLLGLPLLALNAVLSGISLPAPGTVKPIATVSKKSSAPAAKASAPAAKASAPVTTVKRAAPTSVKVSAPKVAKVTAAAPVQRVRKTVRIN
mmetsp:Transcript_13544/g.13613  ORF Transcript_13544/g.13613 Transcript_13544/m.13613 type:complete len:284 (+) Transcript_13544:58-909(+)|eukprot:CAMPEP_0182427100 /NCGR_PEP_ID=MMETSP1167-20130531/14653_1 /TAXON_ID=2988 /ORGANISM="Mallomonas Sp, Strain CCMP3275" /LENGTH=283 /DNA_ID=CAMNT_0024609033 /DNA_START=58 /DNA_END=909 /DNA_ORIENTATION=+